MRISVTGLFALVLAGAIAPEAVGQTVRARVSVRTPEVAATVRYRDGDRYRRDDRRYAPVRVYEDVYYYDASECDRYRHKEDRKDCLEAEREYWKDRREAEREHAKAWREHVRESEKDRREHIREREKDRREAFREYWKDRREHEREGTKHRRERGGYERLILGGRGGCGPRPAPLPASGATVLPRIASRRPPLHQREPRAAGEKVIRIETYKYL